MSKRQATFTGSREQPPRRGAILALAAVAAAIVWVFTFGVPIGSADKPSGGPVRTLDDIPPHIQKVLKQAPAPTHSQPTPWGLFVINPVINGAGVLNPQHSPVPDLSGSSATRMAASGDDAIARVRALGLPALDVPVAFRKGMALNHVYSASDGARFSFALYFGAGDGTPEFRSLVVQAFTPMEPVVFDEFPDNAIWDFAATSAVLGYPTLTVFPDKGTADPRDERVVAWSQASAVYYVRTTGLFTDQEVLALARLLAMQEETK